MATREELADTLAGFALFADLGSPQLLSVAGLFEEVVRPDGRARAPPGPHRVRLLRRSSTATADVCIDGTSRAPSHRGDFFGEVSILLGEPPTADVVATSPLRLLVLGPAAVKPFLLAHPP